MVADIQCIQNSLNVFSISIFFRKYSLCFRQQVVLDRVDACKLKIVVFVVVKNLAIRELHTVILFAVASVD